MLPNRDNINPARSSTIKLELDSSVKLAQEANNNIPKLTHQQKKEIKKQEKKQKKEILKKEKTKKKYSSVSYGNVKEKVMQKDEFVREKIDIYEEVKGEHIGWFGAKTRIKEVVPKEKFVHNDSDFPPLCTPKFKATQRAGLCDKVFDRILDNPLIPSKLAEKCLVFIDNSFSERDLTPLNNYSRLMRFYDDVEKRRLGDQYKVGTRGFHLFKAFCVRFILKQISLFGDRNEAEEFSRQVVDSNDQQFCSFIASYIETYCKHLSVFPSTVEQANVFHEKLLKCLYNSIKPSSLKVKIIRDKIVPQGFWELNPSKFLLFERKMFYFLSTRWIQEMSKPNYERLWVTVFYDACDDNVPYEAFVQKLALYSHIWRTSPGSIHFEKREDIEPQANDQEDEQPQGFWDFTVKHTLQDDQMERITGAIEKIAEVTNPEAAKEIGCSLASGMLSKLNPFNLLPEGFLSNFRQFVKNSSGMDLDMILMIQFLAVCAWCLFTKEWNWTTLAIMVTSLLLVYTSEERPTLSQVGAKVQNLVEEVFGFLKGYFCGTKPQAVDKETSVDVLIGVIGIVTGVRNCTSWTDFSKSIKGFNNMSKDLESYVSYVVGILQKVGDFACKKLLGVESFRIFTEELPGLHKWTEEVHDLVASAARGDLTKNIANSEKIIALERKGIDFLGKAKQFDAAMRVKDKLRPLLSSLSALRSTFEHSGIYNKNSRQEPVMIMLKGGSQIGKTFMIRPLIARILAAIDKENVKKMEEDFDSMVFPLNPDSEYWEGYYDQPVLMMDEYSIVPPHLATAQNIQTTVVKCKNTFPFLLNMAELKMKGQIYFKGKLIIGTTNVKDTFRDARQYVACPEAVTNRIDFDLDVIVREEFATEETKHLEPRERCLDKNKIPPTPYGFYWKLHTFDLITYTTIGSEVRRNVQKIDSVDELVPMIVAKYRKYEQAAELQRFALKDAIRLGDSERIEPQGLFEMNQFNIEKFMKLSEECETYSQLIAQCQMLSWTSVGGTPYMSSQFNIDDYIYCFKDQETRTVFKRLKPHDMRVIGCVLDSVPGFADWVSLAEHEKVQLVVNILKKFSATFEKDVHKNVTKIYYGGLPFEGTILAANAMFRSIKASGQRWVETSTLPEWFKCLLSKSVSILANGLPILIAVGLIYKGISMMSGMVKAVIGFVLGTSTEDSTSTNDPVKIFNDAVGSTQPNELQKKELANMEPVVKLDNMNLHLKPVAQANAQQDLESLKIAGNIIKKNFFDMYFAGLRRGSGVFVKKNYFLCSAHYADMIKFRIKDDEEIVLKSYDGTRDVTVNRKTFFSEAVKLQKSDLMLVKVKAMSNDLPDITAKFVTDKDMSFRARGNALFARKMDGMPMIQSMTFRSLDPISYSGPWNKKQPIQIDRGFQYSVNTQAGDCGSLVLIDDVSLPARKIFGMHCAGNTEGRYGIAAAVTQEMLRSLISSLEAEPQGLWDNGFKTMKIIAENVSPLPGSNSRSEIVRSPLHGAWGPAKKAPARLNNFVNENGETVDVLWEALKEYDEPVGNLPSQPVELIMSCVFNDMRSESPNQEPMRVVPLQVAVEGRIGTLYEPLPRATSSGYPWNAIPRPGFPGKTRFLGIDMTVRAYDDALNYPEELGFNYNTGGVDWKLLKQEMLNMYDMMNAGKRPSVVYTGSKKDELRSLEKVKTGKTRYFSGKPLSYLILCKIFFGSFEVWIKKNKIFNSICIGINPHSDDWNILYKAAKQFEFQSDGDFKGFDKRQMQNILWQIGVEIRKMYSDKYDHIRAALWLELVNSCHLVGDKVVMFSHSLPSGHWLTTIVNCIYVMFAVRFCWLVAHAYNYWYVLVFRAFCKEFVYGDDLLLCMTEEAAKVFDEHPLPDLFALMKLQFTSGNKITAYNHRTVIEDCTFLKRAFRYEPYLGRVVGPLSLETILEIPYWTKRREGYNIFRTNMEVAICELAIHDDDTFNEWIAKINAGCISRGFVIPACYPRHVILDMITGDITSSLSTKMRLNLHIMNSKPTSNTTKVRTSPVKVELVDEEYESSNSENIIVDDLVPQGDDTTVTSDVSPGHGSAIASPQMVSSPQSDTVGAHFDDDAVVQVVRVTNEDLKSDLKVSADIGLDQTDLRRFLGKPARLGQFTWNTQTANQNMLVLNLPSDMVALPIYNSKLYGFRYIRATIEIRVTANANPFTQGRLMCSFSPVAQATNMFPGIRTRSLVARSQLPRVELDLACDTEAIMTIPYVGPLVAYDMENRSGPHGRFYIAVYAPLQSGTGGVNECEITVYGRFLDVEIHTPDAIQPQGAMEKSELEQKSLATGPISGTLAGIAKIGASLSKVPGIGAIAGRAGWVAGILSGAASAFGYSKPLNEEIQARMAPQVSAYLANCDGLDNSQPLSLMACNKVEAIPGFAGTDTDENNLLHLCQIYAYDGVTRTWSDSQVANATIADVEISPFVIQSPYNTPEFKCWDFGPMGYFAQMFGLYRGSIRMKIKVVKTKFHSGRLLLTYNVSGFNLGTDFLLREIIDIREKSEFEYIIPYARNIPYLSMYQGVVELMGHLRIQVLNPLQHPATVANNVQLLFEFAAGPDFELAAPCGTTMKVYVPTPLLTAQSNWESEDDVYMLSLNNDVEPQGNDDEVCDTTETCIGGTVVPRPTLNYSLACIGERVTSVLQLCKRATRCVRSGGDSWYAPNIRPFTFCALHDANVAVEYSEFPAGDNYAYIAPCFAFSRGGMRIKCLRRENVTSDTMLAGIHYFSTAQQTYVDAGNVADHTPLTVNSFAKSTHLEVSVPQYTQGISRLNRFSMPSAPEPVDFYTTNYRLITESSSNDKKVLLRSVADDFSFGYFIGVPLLAYESNRS